MPLIMLSGLFVLVTGFLVPGISVFLGWLLGLLISYVLVITSWLAKLPGAGIEVKIPFVSVVIIYLVMAGLIYQPLRMWLFNKLKRLRPDKQINLNTESEIVTEIIDLNNI
jgi:uncharacterized PurR-regulated membrane protein YhhQ (DUF165 family)